MSQSRIQELLAELRTELSGSTFEDDTHQRLDSLDSAVQRMPVDDDQPSDTEALLQEARALEARFAVEHPAAEQFMRYIVNTLARMGI